MRSRFIAAILSALFGAGAGSSRAGEAQVAAPGAADDGGFVDLELSVVAERCPGGDSDCCVLATGEIGGARVGFRVIFKGGMKPGIVNNELDRSAFAPEGVIFERSGAESDEFLQRLAGLYKLAPQGRAFAERVPTTSFALSGDPGQISKEALRFKVFFNDSGGEDEYAELYINLDLRQGVLEFHEKDPEYRKNVVQALTSAR